MFVRIVKMTFETNKIAIFTELFNKHKEQIRGFEGCTFLELYQDKNNSAIFFTYSYWETEAHLENYRNSALFAQVWKATKALFADKPQAWSVDKLVSLT
jgi:hypothetical protein